MLGTADWLAELDSVLGASGLPKFVGGCRHIAVKKVM